MPAREVEMENERLFSRWLMRLERFGALSASDRQRIADLPRKLVNLPAEHHVISRDHAPTQCALVLGGFLYSHKLVADSRRQIISFFVPGDVPDLSALFLPDIDCDITTLGPAVLAWVPHRALKDALDRSPNLARAFWREILMQTAISRECVANLGSRNAIARVAHIVCELTVRLQAVGLARDLSFTIPWTQIDLADACGISSVHVNRVVQELRLRSLLDFDSKRVKIRDWNSLVQLGDFNDDYLQLGRSTKKEPSLASSGRDALAYRSGDQHR
jgi:CRP-like cAMP-binding protein